MARSARRKFGNAWQLPTRSEAEEQWRREREQLESAGQQTMRFKSIGVRMRPVKHPFDLSPGAEMADQDWTTPGFWPRRTIEERRGGGGR